MRVGMSCIALVLYDACATAKVPFHHCRPIKTKQKIVRLLLACGFNFDKLFIFLKSSRLPAVDSNGFEN